MTPLTHIISNNPDLSRQTIHARRRELGVGTRIGSAWFLTDDDAARLRAALVRKPAGRRPARKEMP
jgi:hypothetical protein